MKRDEAILLMLAGLAAGCKSTGDFGLKEGRMDKPRELIVKMVPDDEQRMAMLSVVDSLEQALKKIETDALTERNHIAEENRDYYAPISELEKPFKKLEELTEQLGETTKRHSLELRALCSEQEWKQIASHKTQAIHFTF